MHILSLDFGTSSLKVALLDEKLDILEMVTVHYDYKVTNKDWVELDTCIVFEAVIKGLKKFSMSLDKVEVIGFDTFSPSVVFMGKDGNALYPIITHLDRRSKKQTDHILSVMGLEKFQGITGVQPFTGGVSITTIIWMMENNPEIFKNTFKIGHLNTYIYHRFTDCWATDYVNASMMGLYETVKWGEWSEEILSTFKIQRSKLPRILSIGTLGTLSKNAAKLMGLREGIPVALGTNDAATAQLGAGNVKTGEILNISGSSEMVSILIDKPVVSKSYYLRNSITPNVWQVFAITASGFAIDWFKKQFYREMEDERFFNVEFSKVINNHTDISEVKFLPYIAGDRQSLTPKKGAFTGLSLNTTRRDLLGAILLGFHDPILKTIEETKDFIDYNKTIKLTGGMVTPHFVKLKRKIFKDFEFVIKDNCPIIGNSILALQSLDKED